jgi:hypothetical protein
MVLSNPTVPGGRPPVKRKGLYFDPSSWDGSDLFLAGDARFKFVIGAVKRMLEQEKIKNAHFELADTFERRVITV